MVRCIDGEAVSFPKLPRARLLALAAEWAAKDRSALLARMAECGVTGAAKLEELERFDSGCRRGHWGFMACFDPARAAQIVELSSPGCPVTAEIELDDLTRLACEIWDSRSWQRIFVEPAEPEAAVIPFAAAAPERRTHLQTNEVRTAADLARLHPAIQAHLRAAGVEIPDATG